MSLHRRSVECPVRVVALLIALACVAVVLSCSESGGPAGVNNPVEPTDAYLGQTTSAVSAKESEKEWTFLLYASADGGAMYCPLTDFAEHFPSSSTVNALCIEDKWRETAKMWYIDGNRNPVLLQDLGEVNMGSVTTLSDFLDYAKTNYPAKRYIISFYGHGGAWGGACTDMDPEFGVLRMDDMKDALQAAGGVDLVLFSAPCLMGALESAYELRDCAEVYIASENESFYRYWHNAMGSICEELNSRPAVSSVELGRLIIDWMEADRRNYASAFGIKYLTMSAVRTDRLEPLRDAIDELAVAYLADPARLGALLESTRKKIIYFDNTSITDLNSVLLCLHKAETNMAMRARLENVMQHLSDAVISEIYRSKYKDIGGLTIFLPDEQTSNILASYVDEKYGLDFVQDSQWDELLFALFPAVGNVQPTFDEPYPMVCSHRSQEAEHARGIMTLP